MKGAEERWIAEEKVAEARQVEEQWRKSEVITTEGRWVAEGRMAVAAAAAAAAHYKAILEAEAACKVEVER